MKKIDHNLCGVCGTAIGLLKTKGKLLVSSWTEIRIERAHICSTPNGFSPAQEIEVDMGAFFGSMRLPNAYSVGRTATVRLQYGEGE